MNLKSRSTAAAVVALVVFGMVTTPARGETELFGPLRIRDMTPFNLLRLDMLPAHAVASSPGRWAIEAELSHTNTFVMSDNVRAYLEARGTRSPLTQADADSILSGGEDAYYVDGEFGLLDLTFHYGVTHHTLVYLTLPAYYFTGGILDGTIEGFHNAFGLDNGGRDLVARDHFQAVVSLEGAAAVFLDPPTEGGLGDPVLGLRHSWPLRGSRWRLVLDGAAKVALRGERELLSTGTNDFGLQASLQGKFTRQGLFFSTSFVRTDGRVLGVDVESSVIPTLTAAYELGLTSHTNLIFQLYASESTVRDTNIEEIKVNKYQASLGLRSHYGHLIYSLALTENLANYDNTPDIGVSLNLGWISSP